MEKNEQIFHRLAEIDSLKGTEIYNLFEKDIEIIKILFSFNENKIDQNFLKSFRYMITKLSLTDIYQENEDEIHLLAFLRYAIMRYKNNDPKILFMIRYGKLMT